MKIKITKWHIVIGYFDMYWYDAWAKKKGIEIGWKNKILYTTFKN